MSWLKRWWFDELPPLSGPVRYTFFIALLVLAWRDSKSPLRGIHRYAEMDPTWYETHGLMRLLGVGHLPVSLLWVVSGLFGIACLAAAFGLWTRLALGVSAASGLLLHGLYLDSNAYNRAWFIPVYALVALCFARTVGDDVSADARLLKRHPKPDGRVADSSFARKLVLVALVGFYFAAGITKINQAGWAWADGRTLAYELGQHRDLWLAQFLLARPMVAAVASWAALLLELGAPLALLHTWLRYLFVAGWCGMHLAIDLSLDVQYYSNVVVMILMVDWRAVGRWWRERIGGHEDDDDEAAHSESWPRDQPMHRLAMAGGAAWLVLALAVGALQIEWWPLSKIDMYASFTTTEIEDSRPRGEYRQWDRAVAMAKACVEEGCSRQRRRAIARPCVLRLAAANGTMKPLPGGLGVPDKKAWVRMVFAPAVVAQLAAPEGSGQGPASELVTRAASLVPRYVDDAAAFERLVLACGYTTGERILASAPLPR